MKKTCLSAAAAAALLAATAALAHETWIATAVDAQGRTYWAWGSTGRDAAERALAECRASVPPNIRCRVPPGVTVRVRHDH